VAERQTRSKEILADRRLQEVYRTFSTVSPQVERVRGWQILLFYQLN
jgi:hypothetical protein